jgi:nitroreductase
MAEALAACFYDFRAFAAASGAVTGPVRARTFEAQIVKEYHRIEKGLALPEPRPGFGQKVVDEVARMTREYEARFGSTFHMDGARASLLAYRAADTCLPETAAKIAGYTDGWSADGAPEAGARWVTRDEIRSASAIDFEAFACSRYSVRDFSDAPVPLAVVEAAVRQAMKSPRVCNRGTARCHALFDPALRARALSYQNGNGGFGDRAGAVLIVTSDRQGFLSVGERNQCWVDGGLFAMSLAFALHAAGYGTCMLNWSATPAQDRALRRAIPIPRAEGIVTMMAVGSLKDRFRVAISPREPVETAFIIHGSA